MGLVVVALVAPRSCTIAPGCEVRWYIPWSIHPPIGSYVWALHVHNIFLNFEILSHRNFLHVAAKQYQ